MLLSLVYVYINKDKGMQGTQNIFSTDKQLFALFLK